MKKFTCQVLLFLGVMVVVVIIYLGGIYFMQSSTSFALPPDKHILVLGDSHTECAIDDDIFSRAENVSQSASTYLHSYCKLRKFLDKNEHVDTVLLSFHFPGLTVSVDDRWLFNEKYMMMQLPRYVMLMDREEMAIFANRKKTFVKAVLQFPLKFLINFARKGGRGLSYRDLDIGGYLNLDRDKLQENIARHDREVARGDTAISSYQKAYLLKIVELCEARGVELILINSPMYKPEVYSDPDRRWKDFHATYLPGVTYLDYSAFPLPDSCYGDIQHLNYKGARIFSKYLQENF
jgi:hypothetical protein